MTTWGEGSSCDVVIVGLGATGALAAEILTAAGANVVALEVGPHRFAAEMTQDELRNDIRHWLATPKAAHEEPTWRSTIDDVAGPSPWPMVMMNAVGGSTVHYEGLSPRFHPWNFQSRTETIRRYGAGAIPVGSTLADWPVSYDELEPYYGNVEHAIGVAGAVGNRNGVPSEGGDPFEGPRTKEYLLPPLRRTGWTELTAESARTLGWHPFPAPAAINSVPFDGRPACTYCGFCANNGCYTDAKNSADVNFAKRAIASGRLRVELGARATEVLVDDNGLASGVRYLQDGEEKVQTARVVLIGTFTFENTRLLLHSKSKAFPNGLANNAGQVGKHFIAHTTPHVYGTFPGRRLNLFTGLWSQSTVVTDWNADNFDHSDLGFISGGMMAAFHELRPIGFANAPTPDGVPRWGAGWKAWIREHAQSVGSMSAQFDSLSYEDNSLDLDPTVRDRDGVPVVRVTYRLHENEERGHDFLQEKMAEWLGATGAAQTWFRGRRGIEPRHSYGGTRMGHDPSSSVVDEWSFAHEVPNLGVMGTSTFPTAGGHNPTLTVQALIWRMAEHLVDQWESIAASPR